MAQTIKLKRSATSGAVPTTSQLELGEVAINTNDGKMYFEKDNGTASIREVVTADQSSGDVDLSGHLSFGDSKEVRLGASDDLKLYHDGSDSYISEEGTGNLYLKSDGLGFKFQSGWQGTMYDVVDILAIGTTIQYLGSPKFTVGSTGAEVFGDLVLSDTTADSAAGPELTFERNSASPADADYLGQLKFQGKNDAAQDVLYAKITGKIDDVTDGTEDGIIETALKKAGSNVIVSRQTGSALKLINGSGLEVDGDVELGDNSKAKFGDGDDLQIYHDGSTSYIDDAGTGGLDIRSNEVKLSKYTGETLATFTADGAVSLRYNNAQKLSTTSTGVSVTGTITADSQSVGTQSIVSTAPTSTSGFPNGHVWYVV